MKGFRRRSSNPFIKGTRPRQFFGELLKLMKEKQSIRSKKVFDPEWNKLKMV